MSLMNVFLNCIKDILIKLFKYPTSNILHLALAMDLLDLKYNRTIDHDELHSFMPS